MFYSLDKSKPKTKTKNKISFISVNENLTTFLYTLNRGGGQENIFLERGKNIVLFFLRVYNKVERSTTKKFGF